MEASQPALVKCPHRLEPKHGERYAEISKTPVVRRLALGCTRGRLVVSLSLPTTVMLERPRQQVPSTLSHLMDNRCTSRREPGRLRVCTSYAAIGSCQDGFEGCSLRVREWRGYHNSKFQRRFRYFKLDTIALRIREGTTGRHGVRVANRVLYAV